MGLDMTLTATQYTSNALSKEIAESLDSIQGLDYEVQSVTIEVAYWRKANAIHNWFVENVQDGVDECDRHYVFRDSLIELLFLCKQVDEDNSLAEKLLPTKSGFFFGSTDYDSYYFESIKETITMIEGAINLPECWNFHYQSSW